MKILFRFSRFSILALLILAIAETSETLYLDIESGIGAVDLQLR